MTCTVCGKAPGQERFAEFLAAFNALILEFPFTGRLKRRSVKHQRLAAADIAALCVPGFMKPGTQLQCSGKRSTGFLHRRIQCLFQAVNKFASHAALFLRLDLEPGPQHGGFVVHLVYPGNFQLIFYLVLIDIVCP